MIRAHLSQFGQTRPFPTRFFAQRPYFCGANSLNLPKATLRRIELRAKPENMHP